MNTLPEKYTLWIQREEQKGTAIEDLEWIADFYYQNIEKFAEKDIDKWDGKQLLNHIKEEGMYCRYNYIR